MAKTGQPVDANNQLLRLAPSATTLATTYDATISSSTEVTLDGDTTIIEVGALDSAILVRWGTANASTTDFDYVVPTDTVRHFRVPDGVTAVNFIEQSATAILCCTEF